MNHRDTETQREGKGHEPGPLADLTEAIIGAAIEVHRTLGPGLLESAYEAALCRELTLRGIRFQRQLSLPLIYKNEPIDVGYRIDLIVEDELIVELKTVDKIIDIRDAQLLTYLRLTNKRVGLIINFKVALLKNGIHRRVL